MGSLFCACYPVWQVRREFDFGNSGTALGLGKDKGMETFQEAWGAFALYRLPGSYGCLIFNKLYPTGAEVSLPTQEEVVRIFTEIRFLGVNTPKGNVGQTRFGKLVAWFSKKLSRVALSAPIIRAYISPCKSCKNSYYDCKGSGTSSTPAKIDLTQIGKELFEYEEPGRKFEIRLTGYT